MNVTSCAEVQVPQLLGLTPDAPRPGGLLQADNVYVVDGGNSFKSKDIGRFCEDDSNVVSIAGSIHGLSLFEWGMSDGTKNVVIDSNPFV